ncbi:MAG: hypothetical protein LBK67_05470, partial [Coriobacteriales bacterium]|nr:hypothetical protein [Coriobacteriales bacterium]
MSEYSTSSRSRTESAIGVMQANTKMGGAATQNALRNNFAPLFSLNYSATHKTSHNLVYVLDALDAFQKKLVKKIEVKGFEIKNLRGSEFSDDISAYDLILKNKERLLSFDEPTRFIFSHSALR